MAFSRIRTIARANEAQGGHWFQQHNGQNHEIIYPRVYGGQYFIVCDGRNYNQPVWHIAQADYQGRVSLVRARNADSFFSEYASHTDALADVLTLPDDTTPMHKQDEYPPCAWENEDTMVSFLSDILDTVAGELSSQMPIPNRNEMESQWDSAIENAMDNTSDGQLASIIDSVNEWRYELSDTGVLPRHPTLVDLMTATVRDIAEQYIPFHVLQMFPYASED